MKYSWI